MEGKGTASWGAFRPWWGESLCQLPRLGFISRFSSANITLNGEAMCWQGTALALFQLHGIKHRRYSRHRIFIEKGKGREKVVYKVFALPRLWKPALFYLKTIVNQKKVVVWQTVVFSVTMWFIFSYNKAVLTIICCVLWRGCFDFTWLVSLVKTSEKIRAGLYVSLPTCMCFIMNAGLIFNMLSSVLSFLFCILFFFPGTPGVPTAAAEMKPFTSLPRSTAKQL